MKEVSIISKIVGRAVDSMRMPSAAPAASVDLSGYLPKSVWDGVWEIRETDEGTRYVLGKLPVVLQYGLTMYADGSLLDIPSIYDGLPLDNDTIYWEEIKDEEGNVIDKRIKARGGSGEGGITPTLLGDLTNVGAWANGIATEDRIMVQRKDSASWVALNLSEIGGGFAGFSNVLSSGEGNAFTSFILSEDKKTLTFVKGQTFALQAELDKKWTTDSAKIANWNTAYGWGDHSKAGYLKKEVIYDESIGCWKLDGDLLVTGGITMYGVDGSSFGTIWDNAPIATTSAKGIASFDSNYFAVNNGKVTFIGSTGGGIADSVAWDDVTGKPSWIGSSKPSYSYSEITGTPTIPTNTNQLTNGAGFITSSGSITGNAATATTASKLSTTSKKAWGVTYWTDGGVPTDVSGSMTGVGSITMNGELSGATKLDVSVPITKIGDFVLGSLHSVSNLSIRYSNAFGVYGMVDYNSGAFVLQAAYQTTPTALDILLQPRGGNVAIGKTSATCALDVNGTIKGASGSFSGNVSMGSATVNGGNLCYDSTNKYWKLEGDLLVTGGITMYGVDGSSFGTIWDNAPIATTSAKGIASFDPNYFSVNNGHVTFIGSTGGGSADVNELDKRYVKLSGAQTISGEKTFESSIKIKRGFSILDDQGWGIVGVNPTGWTGLPTDGSAIGFGTGAAPVYIRTSGDDLYHYDKTKGASYKILDTLGGTMVGSIASQDIYPKTSNTYSLGTSSYLWSNFYTKKATIDGIEIKKSASGVLFLDANLVVSGAITMYGTDGTTAPTIWDGAPKATTSDTTNGKGIASFDSKFFSVSNGHVTFIGDVGGLDESALASYLSTNKYLTQTTSDARYLAIGGNAASASGLSGLTPIISAANESNEISAVRNSYGAITTNAPTSGAAITNALKFRWYDTDWQIGNVRNMSNGTSGFGVTYGSSNLRFLVKTDGVETYGTLKTNGVIPTSNGSYSLGSSSYKWTSVYATSFEGNATSATTASKLSTTSKTAWGQTYWTSGGVPTSIDGNMSNVGHITMKGNNSYDIGTSSVGVRYIYANWIGAISGGKFSIGANNGTAITILTDQKIGIGTKNPSTALQVDQSEWSNGITINRTISGGGGAIAVRSNGTHIGNFGINGSKQLEFNVMSGSTAQVKMTVDSSGNGLFYGGVTMYSDLRKKTILNHVELSLKEVADAPLIEHYYNSDEAKTTHVGSVAQYWAGLNDWFCKEDGEGFLTMEIQNAALASAISVARELTRYESKTDKQIKKLKKRIGELEEEIENLKNK